MRPADWYQAHDVKLRVEPVVGVDPAAHTLVLQSGQELAYDKVLTVTGGRNRRLTVPGANLPGVHYLRTVAECDASLHCAPFAEFRTARRFATT